jgi:hypothetical protein
MKLDANAVAVVDLGGKRDLIVFDEELPGFGLRLRLNASGDRVRRSWIAQYRAQGRTRRMLIGAIEKVAPADARKAARKILAAAALGGDPQAPRRRAAGRRPAPFGQWSTLISKRARESFAPAHTGSRGSIWLVPTSGRCTRSPWAA